MAIRRTERTIQRAEPKPGQTYGDYEAFVAKQRDDLAFQIATLEALRDQPVATGTAEDCEATMRRLTNGERGCANPDEHQCVEVCAMEGHPGHFPPLLRHPYTCGLCNWGRSPENHSIEEYVRHMDRAHHQRGLVVT